MDIINIDGKPLAASPLGTKAPYLLGVLKRWFKPSYWTPNDVRSQLPEAPFSQIKEGQNSKAASMAPDQFDDEPPAWEDMPGTACVAAWAAEMAAAIRMEPDSLPWSLVGPGALLEVQDFRMGKLILRRAALEAGLGFKSIAATNVLDLELDESDPFGDAAPLLVYLEPGDWARPIDADKVSPEAASSIRRFRQKLEEYLRNVDFQRPVVMVTLTKDFDDVAAPLRSIDYFPRRLTIRPATPDEAGRAFIKELGIEYCGSSLLNDTEKVGKLAKDYENSRMRALHVFSLQRLARQRKQPVEFDDLIQIAVRGTVESDELLQHNPEYSRLVAVHEAGHATVAMIDSSGSNTPEYLSIIPSPRYNGVAVDSIAYRFTQEDQLSYTQMRHRVRVALAGRVAEELAYGAEHVSSGAGEDLQKATQLASHAFAVAGFAPDMGEPRKSSSNLAVVVGEPSLSECAHVERLVREFLASEYCAVKEMLIANQSLLDELVECLVERKAIHQGELLELSEKHNLCKSGRRILRHQSDT